METAFEVTGRMPVPLLGACWEMGWQAHSLRGESCNSDSSPEPAAR